MFKSYKQIHHREDTERNKHMKRCSTSQRKCKMQHNETLLHSHQSDENKKTDHALCWQGCENIETPLCEDAGYVK